MRPLAVEVSIRGTDTALPDGVDLSAYRIVQEGLTNVLRHGGPKAWLTVDRQPGCVRLIGMRERVALFGGTLTAGPRAGGGFELVATLPYRDPP
jgi:signal transduction histidine kinase